MINDQVQKLKTSEVLNLKDPNRNKIYYGFLYNYSSSNTRRAYLKELKKFYAFLRRRFAEITEFEVEHSHLVAYKEELINYGGERTEKLSQNSINRTFACLYAFYEYLLDQGLVKLNPVMRVKRFKIPKEVKTVDLTNEQVDQLLSIIPSDSGTGKLHKAILTLLFTTGMRQSELANLKFKNIDYENEFLVLRYFAKGSKEMVTPLNQRAIDAIGTYLKWCESEEISMNLNDYIFRPTINPKTGNLNKRLDGTSLNYIIKKYAFLIGIKGNVSMHSARSTVIGMLLEKGHSIDRVADFVGHRDISTTKAYNKRKQKIHNSLSFEFDKMLS
jgi:integrase/recombinase XerD